MLSDIRANSHCREKFVVVIAGNNFRTVPMYEGNSLSFYPHIYELTPNIYCSNGASWMLHHIDRGIQKILKLCST